MSSTTLLLDNPPSISAAELHEILLTTHASGNVARLRFLGPVPVVAPGFGRLRTRDTASDLLVVFSKYVFVGPPCLARSRSASGRRIDHWNRPLDALRALHESRLHLQLGFPDIAAYADCTFHYGASQTYDFLRVSKALIELPEVSAAFECGDLSFSLVSELTRVANQESEREWLEFLQGKSIRVVKLELKDALKKGRKHPRRDQYGLPGLPVRVSFEFSPEEHAVVKAGLKKVSREMGQSLGGALPDPRSALLYLLHRVLETEPEGSVTGGREKSQCSPFAVVFHRCPGCLRSAVETGDGRVEVSSEVMDRIEGSAERVVLGDATERQAALPERDRPNTPAIRRALHLREGGRCANPFCSRETGLECGHGHHIQPRSEGGRTDLLNEAWLCVTCHAILHSMNLVIESDPIGGLVWKPAAADTTRSVREDLRRIAREPRVRCVEVRTDSGCPDQSGPPESPPNGDAAADALAALIQLGSPMAEARRLRDTAWARVLQTGESVQAIDADRLLREALRMG